MKKVLVFIVVVLALILIVITPRIKERIEKFELEKILGKEYIFLNNGEKTDITFEMQGDRLFGYSGVNRYSSIYKIERNTIKIEPIMATMMAGPQDKMELESKYLKLLNEAEHIKLTKENLIITTSNKEKLKFVESENNSNTNVNNTAE